MAYGRRAALAALVMLSAAAALLLGAVSVPTASTNVRAAGSAMVTTASAAPLASVVRALRPASCGEGSACLTRVAARGSHDLPAAGQDAHPIAVVEHADAVAPAPTQARADDAGHGAAGQKSVPAVERGPPPVSG